MTESQIREAVERVLAENPGRFYGASQYAPNAVGKRVIDTLVAMAESDIQNTAVVTEESHGLAS